jgi:hypothetical protein
MQGDTLFELFISLECLKEIHEKVNSCEDDCPSIDAASQIFELD